MPVSLVPPYYGDYQRNDEAIGYHDIGARPMMQIWHEHKP